MTIYSGCFPLKMVIFHSYVSLPEGIPKKLEPKSPAARPLPFWPQEANRDPSWVVDTEVKKAILPEMVREMCLGKNLEGDELLEIIGG